MERVCPHGLEDVPNVASVRQVSSKSIHIGLKGFANLKLNLSAWTSQFKMFRLEPYSLTPELRMTSSNLHINKETDQSRHQVDCGYAEYTKSVKERTVSPVAHGV